MALKQDVQQQNEAARLTIASTATTFRSDPLKYPWLTCELQKRGIDLAAGILVSLDSLPEQGGELKSGIWLTPDRRFYRFEVLVSRDSNDPDTVESWEDVTATTLVNAHQRGTGQSFGWLAI